MRTLLSCILFLCITIAYSQNELITTWKTDNPGVSDENQITIPSYYGNYGEITIAWGDGTIDTYSNSYNLIHTYANPGTYSVEITGNFPGFYFKDWGDKQKIISVDQWGDIEWIAAQEAFSGCENLDVIANDSPNLSKVTSTNQMFSGCYSLVGTPAFNNWDVSTITNMDSMFSSCSIFNSPIGNWDVSNVENMPAMFVNATSFNEDIGNWDVSNVKIMWAMFSGCHSFNQNINNWNVSNVISMGWMFTNARAFNQPLSSWDVSKVISMDLMFDNALAFNQNISNWDVSNVTNMRYMFKNAKSFNQPVGDWDVSSVSNMESMFANAEIFNQPLNTWEMTNVINSSKMFYYAYNFRQDISSWDVSAVTDMSGMFNGATTFNLPINNWDVSSVTDMTKMFNYAYSFNQNLSNWNVSNVTAMDNMFHGANSFKQDISTWNIRNVTSMADMFLDIGMSKIVYDNILNAWSALPQLQNNVIFNAGNSEYCSGSTGKDELINNYNWTIIDSGEVCFSPNQFVTKWKTDNLGTSADNQITIPTYPYEIYNYSVNWGDGNIDTNINGDITHTYDTPGTYYVSISGIFPRIYFNENGDNDKILTINQWGSNQWSSMESAFANCSNLSVAANDVPNLTNVTSLSRMFYYCSYGFDNSRTRMFSNFNGIKNFNDWNVSNIIDISYMFDKSAFNQDISQWDVSGVVNMSHTFYSTPFNFDISKWDVGNVTNMSGMFGSSNFNQDVTSWNVSNVTNMDFLFNSTYFDQDISSWNVSNVITMRHMLSQSSFNQDVSSWDISNVFDMSNIFDDNDLSRDNYDNILIGWSQLPTLQTGTILGAKDVQYCSSKDARKLLIENFNWNIFDQGENCEIERPFITSWKTDNPGASDNNQITIPTNPYEVYNYNVDWGDGTKDVGVTEDITHSYEVPGTYQVSITGRFPQIFFNNSDEDYPYQVPRKTADPKKIISIDQWGTVRWNSMSFAFAGCSNLDVLASDVPDFSKGIEFSHMFYNCSSLIGNESMELWDLSNTIMSANAMFSGASLFNQSIDNWDVSNIRYLNDMFKNATSFNQNLENWNISKVENMDAMFNGSGISIANYDKILNAWSTLPSLINNVKFGAADTNFCNSIEARNELINTYGWQIIDSGNDCSGTYFITTWKTDNPGVSEDNQIIIPTFPGQTYDYTVDWGDGTIESNFTGDATHTYLTPGIFQVSISGEFPRIYFEGNFGNDSNGDFIVNDIDDNDKILSVDQWGDIKWNSMEAAFYGCSNLDVVAIDTPDLSNVQSMNEMFLFCTSLKGTPSFNNWDLDNVTSLASLFFQADKFNQDIGSWDTSNVTNMNGIFLMASSFNQNINGWDTSNVTNLGTAFHEATSFNQPLNNWDVSAVRQFNSCFGSTNFNQPLDNWNPISAYEMTNMFADNPVFNQNINSWNVSSVTNFGGMFGNATAFDQPLNDWNVSAAEFLGGMFSNATSFNQPLNDWDVSSVKEMVNMFAGASKFNQNITSWDTSSVTDISGMFSGAEMFNQNLSMWNVAKVTDMYYMFAYASSFNQDLGGWNVSNVTNMELMFLDTGLSLENYDSTLIGWSNLSLLQNNVNFNASSSQYCESEQARQMIIDTYGWTITDGGKASFCNEDNDFDGILDHKDSCLDTRPNVIVNDNGCEIIAADAILVYGATPTCPGEANGSISISSELTDYIFNIAVEGPVSTDYNEVSLNENIEVANLTTGLYMVTISIPDISYSQTYGIQINEVGSISGKRESLNTSAKTATYNVEGSYTYIVDINGELKNFSFTSNGKNEIQLSDLSEFNAISIKGESDCQGMVTDSFGFSDGIIMFPTITSGEVFIQGYEESSTVLVYDLSGKLVISKTFSGQDSNAIDLQNLENGMYPIVIQSKKGSKTFKIIKQ